MRRRVILLVAWTAIVWLGRVRNLVSDDELSSGGRVGRSVLAAGFVILAMWIAAGVVRGRLDSRVVSVLVALTLVVWLVRGTAIAFGDHATGFKVVHTVLAVVSIGLASWVAAGMRAMTDRPAVEAVR